MFRYTQIRVFFDSALIGVDGSETDEAVQAARSRAFEEAKQTGMSIVNYVLDIYRYVTSAEHVERLSAMAINRVYFVDYNLLSEGVAIDSGVGSAVVNRSGQEIRRMRAMLLAGTEPERHVLLIQSSRAALGRGQLVLAVVVGFQALEILLETKLRAAYERQGLSEGETTDRLKRFYKTKDRLTVLCREVTGGVSIADDTAFWNLWLTACNRKRNGVVHRNEAVTYSEALRVVELCEQSMNLLSALPFPP